MKVLLLLLTLLAGVSCTRQPSLPANSKYNVTGVLNDSLWFGTGKVLRFHKADTKAEKVRQFNFFVYTDIDYPGMGSGPNPNTNNGCLDPECTKTQGLLIYNVPLRKGRHNIAQLDKQGQLESERSNLTYLANSGGVLNRYIFTDEQPAWIKISKLDRKSGIIEGRFAMTLKQDTSSSPLPLRNKMSPNMRFTDGLFRVKITDILLK